MSTDLFPPSLFLTPRGKLLKLIIRNTRSEVLRREANRLLFRTAVAEARFQATASR